MWHPPLTKANYKTHKILQSLVITVYMYNNVTNYVRVSWDHRDYITCSQYLRGGRMTLPYLERVSDVVSTLPASWLAWLLGSSLLLFCWLPLLLTTSSSSMWSLFNNPKSSPVGLKCCRFLLRFFYQQFLWCMNVAWYVCVSPQLVSMNYNTNNNGLC